MPAPKNLVGKRFGKLVVVERLGVIGNDRAVKWRCKCDCGGESTPNTTNLTSGNSQSCGCDKRSVLGKSTTKHGLHNTPEYKVWKGMWARCTNPNMRSYRTYGAAGITVDPTWKDFAVFYSDMGPRPTGSTLDRIDNTKGYSRGNCRWATRAEQSRNTRQNVNATIDGTTLCIADWAKVLGISRGVLTRRAKRWGLAEAIRRYLVEKHINAPYGTTLHITD